MAVIEQRKNKNGTTSYRVSIRRKNKEFNKTFMVREDAEVYAFYKERLIDNMENFEVEIEDRLTLKQIFEIKLNDSSNLEKRSILDMENAFKLINQFIDLNKFLYDIKYKDWEIAAKQMINTDVFMGAKTEAGKRKMSLLTLRRNFACYSSAFSNAISKGFKIENFPLKILQTHINPMIKNKKAAM